MNKTIIININGIVFHIEEDAYEILKNYMTDVKRHFSTSADSLEITTDIENRIAEMFSEILLKENKQVVVEQDVKLVVEQMGTVADFEHAENDSKADSAAYTYNTEGRRLFRDPDDHLVGGICAGIANYFDINPVWIRLAFAISFAFAGSGFILYIILWIVIPKAVTRADRMAMKGEKQNLQGFKKNFEDEINSVKQNLSSFGNEARPFVYKARDFAGDFFHHLGIFLNGAGKVLIKLVGIFIMLMCFGGVIALVVSFVAVFVLGKEPVHIHLFPFNVIKNQYASNVYIAAFSAAIIPLIAIILLIIKAVFNTGSIGRSTATVFFVLWLCSLGMLAFYGVKISNEFRESARFTQNINIKPTANNTYYLKLNDVKYFSHEDSLRLDIKNNFQNMIVVDDDENGINNEPRNVTINIEKSDVKQPVLEESFRANGRDFYDALSNARNTSYVFAQQDSVLKFDYALRKRPNINWHDEEVTLTLKIPLNAKLVIDERLQDYLNDGTNVYDCKGINKQDKASTATFIMTDNGLQCKVDTLVTAKKDSVKIDSAQ